MNLLVKVAIALCILICGLRGVTPAQTVNTGKQFPAWQPGYLDIHHINTGRGNAAFFIFPDATTMLVDAGELSPLDDRTFTPRNATIKPSSSKKPFEWIAYYINKIHPQANNKIDYVLITHFHDDHFGAWYNEAPLSANGKYYLTGITGIGDIFKIGKLVDRGFPNYNYPYDLHELPGKYGGGEIEFEKTMHNYFSFLKEKQKSGTKAEALIAGSDKQVALLNNPSKYPSFYVQNIKSAQWIWTGKDTATINQFPAYDPADKNTWPDENSLSLAIAVHYGPFTYYTGGDNPGMVFPGDNPLRNTETKIAEAIGQVDVATMDHHGNRDAINEFMIKTLRPRVWIGQTWSADHPGHEVLLRLTNKYIYDQPGDLFCTNMLDANRYVIGPLIDRAYKSQQGHIIVRVLPGGEQYYVIVLDDADPSLKIKSVSGPYYSKIK